MAEEKTFMPGDVPGWVKEAQEQIDKGEPFPQGEETPEVTIKFGKGLVGEPFTLKNGKELVEVKIPNEDPADKSPWASFVVSPKLIHDNKFGKGVWMKLPEDGTTKVTKPIFIGTMPNGKKAWERDVKDVPNTELKAMMEAYKTRDRSSVIDNLQEKKEESAKQPVKPQPAAAKAKSAEAVV